MPKGQKLIDWTAENDAKLMLTILAVENVKPNCENVAKAFGGSVNAVAIANRLSRLRRKAAEEGLMPKEGAAVPAKGHKKGGKKGETVAKRSEHEPPAVKTSAKGQKVLTGRVTKARVSGKTEVKSNGKMSDDVDDGVKDNGADVAAVCPDFEDEISEEELD